MSGALEPFPATAKEGALGSCIRPVRVGGWSADREWIDRWDASFSEIEAILGERLPVSARRHGAWWANERVGTHSHARAWLAAGFETSPVALAHNE